MLKRISAVFVMFLLPFIAAATTCPSGYSEFSVNDGHVIVPMSEQCPDGLVQLYTVSDCADVDAGSVCATCGSGYALGNSASCVELCSADSKQIHFGNKLSFNLLKKSGTKPALNFLTPKNQVCYVDLASGTASGLNFELPDGTQYHAVNNSGGYRVCAAGYTLDYDCGAGGGVPPESQSLLSGYWYTIPSGAGSCRVPEGMRFSGWYMDGKKQAPYTIHSYNFNMNKTLTAMFSDLSNYKVNYFCSVNDVVPVYSDDVVVGESVAPQSNMCTANPDKVESLLAWIEPLSQEEINAMVALGLDLSDTSDFGFFASYFGVGDGLIKSEVEELVFLLVLSVHVSCINDPEYQVDNPESCALAKILFEHTYFPNFDALIGSSDVDEDTQMLLQMLYKEIASETDVDLYPLFIPTLYNMTWDCGDYFSVYGGYDFDGETRYGWTVEYRCEPSYNYGYGDLYGVSFVGWDVDGVLYEGANLTYIWTEDKTATGVFDYNLKAMFDCGTDGVLSAGDATLSYAGRGLADMYVPLNINAQCTPNIGKNFIGWKISGARTDTVYHVGDTLDWVDSIVAAGTANTYCDSYDYSCSELKFEAVYEDVLAGNINYYCSVDDSVPTFTDQLIFGNSIDVKTNMCPYDVKTSTGFAWFGKFTDEQKNNLVTLLSQSGLQDPYAGAVYEFYINGKDSVDNDVELLSLAMLYSAGKECVQNAEMQASNPKLCELLQILYWNTYFESPDIVGDEYYKQIYTDGYIDLRPVYIGAMYNVNFDCGKYFKPGAGDLNDVAWTVRYGWDKTYYCVDLNGQDYSFDVRECDEFDESGNCMSATTAIDMVGWQIDGQEYGQTFKYTWTTDQNAVAVFDYNLSATFDCGADGALASGSEKVTYTGRNVGTDEISLNIDATCASNASRTFVGWKLVNNDTQYKAGDTVNWLDAFLNQNNCDSLCKRLTFEAVYESTINVNYYCSVNDTTPTYSDKINPDDNTATFRVGGCEYDTGKYDFVGWFTPFTAEEITTLQNKTGYENLAGSEILNVFVNRTSDKIITDFETFAVLLYLYQNGQSIGNAALDYLAELISKHIMPASMTLTETLDVYVLYGPYQYTTGWNCGKIGNVASYMQDVNAFYGNTFEIASNCVFGNENVWSAGGLAEFTGWDVDGDFYADGDEFVWNYTEDKTFVGLYDYNLHANFDCGADGVLASGDASVTYTGRGNGTDAIPLKVTAKCTPNAGKKFVGWSLPYYSEKTISVGTQLNWLNIITVHDTAELTSATDDFVAVYEDVVDVNYYCSASDTLPTYTNQYSANTTSAPLRQSGCSYDTKKYEFGGWYTPFTAEEVAKLKSYSFDTKYPEYWDDIEPMFIRQTDNYILNRDNWFTMAALWAGYSSTNDDPGLKYLAQILQKHWYIKGYSTSLTLSGNIDLYVFYTGKLYSVNFDCGAGEYSFWDDWNTGYYGATQRWCDSCRLSGAGFAGWEVDGVLYEQCEPVVWNWTNNVTATGVYDYNMTANFDCGADGNLESGDAIVKNNARGNSTDAIPLNITAQCKPNAGKKFVGWANGGKIYTVGNTLNWLSYLGDSVIDFAAVYEDVIDVNYYCDASNKVPTFTDQYSADTTSVALRQSGCEYDSGTYSFFGWYTPFTAEETAKLKSYSFDIKHKDLWAVVEPTFVNNTSSYAYDYDAVFILAGLYAGYGLDTNSDAVKYLTELLQKHWFLSGTDADISENTDFYAFYYKW